MDSLLTLPNAIDEADLPGIMEFVRLCFQLFLTWMEEFPKYSEAYKECQQYPLLFCVDLPAAISQCCFELVEPLGKVFGMCARARNLFVHFRSQFIRDGVFSRQEKVRDDGFAMSLINVFGECNGFQRILNMINQQTPGCEFPLSLVGKVLYNF